MQIQIISSQDEIQSTFSRMFAEAVKSLPSKETLPPPCILNGDELKEQIGVTIQTIIRWRKKGKIPYMQIGSAVRYDLNAVLAALAVNTKKGVKNG